LECNGLEKLSKQKARLDFIHKLAIAQKASQNEAEYGLNFLYQSGYSG